MRETVSSTGVARLGAARTVDGMSMLTEDEIATALAGLPGWSADAEAITKTYEFADFRAALDFMNRAAGPIEEADHHPEWTNVQTPQVNKWICRLTSHDEGGVTKRDTALAVVLDRVYEATS